MRRNLSNQIVRAVSSFSSIVLGMRRMGRSEMRIVERAGVLRVAMRPRPLFGMVLVL